MRCAICTIAAGVLLLSTEIARPQSSMAKLTLPVAMKAALAKHPVLRRAEHLTGAARERVREAQSGMMPSLSVQSTATNGPLGAPAMGLMGLAGDPIKKHYGTGLNLILPIYDFGRTQHLAASRSMLANAAREDEDVQRSAVLLNVQTAYLAVLRQQELVTVQEQSVRLWQETLRQAQTFADAGLKADVDAQLARANLADARLSLIAAQNGVRAAFAELNNAMGETRLAEYQLEPPAAGSSGQPGTAELAMALAEKQRPEVRSAELQVRSGDQAVRAAKSELLPRIDTIGSVGYINPSKLITDNKPFAVGAAVTIPIFTGGLVEGRIAEERQKRDAAEAALAELKESVKLQVARAWLNVQTRTEQLAAAREQVTAANASLSQATQRYQLQLNSVVELVSAEAIATRSRAAAVNAEYDLQQARAELEWAVGGTVLRYPAPARRK